MAAVAIALTSCSSSDTDVQSTTGAGSATSGAPSPSPSTSKQKSSGNDTAKELKVGDSVKQTNFKFTLNKFTDPTKLPNSMTPAEAGTRGVSISGTLKNISDQQRLLASAEPFVLRDAAGRTYNPFVVSARLRGRIAAGDSVSSDVFFAVPPDAKNLKLTFLSDVISSPTLFSLS